MEWVNEAEDGVPRHPAQPVVLCGWWDAGCRRQCLGTLFVGAATSVCQCLGTRPG